MLAAAGDSAEAPIPVAIETPRGLLVAALRATGRPVYPINPLAVARYRERTSVSGKKSDHVDAMALANILRTDRASAPDAAGRLGAGPLDHACWPAPTRTRCGGAPSWCRNCGPGCGSTTRASWPRSASGSGSGSGMSTTQLASGDARAVLAIAPSPAEAAAVSKARVETALRRGGRQRRITSRRRAHRRCAADPAAAAGAAGGAGDAGRDPRTAWRARRRLRLASTSSPPQLAEAFAQHPDYQIITSFPGLADISGAIVLAEIGDDRNRFADDRALQAFAGSAPVTRASGKSRTVTRRRTKNNRLAAIGYSWAFTAAARPSPAREHYLRRRDRGDGHPAALRHLFNRMLGQLHHCLPTGQTYDPAKAFPHATGSRDHRPRPAAA